MHSAELRKGSVLRQKPVGTMAIVGGPDTSGVLKGDCSRLKSEGVSEGTYGVHADLNVD